LSTAVVLASLLPAAADETDARNLLQAMSDFLAAQDTLSVEYDAMWEVVTTEEQKLGIASSGAVSLARPDRVHATRSNGFEDLTMVFDGETFSMAAAQAGVYTSVAISGTIDTLIDTLRDTYGRPFPAADLLGADPFTALMSEVVDVKDLGSGMIAGAECDHLAFRTDVVDWQIWIAQGAEPYPCRFLITSRTVAQAPNYVVDFRAWGTADAVAADAFAFTPSAGATELGFPEFAEAVAVLPQHYSTGENQ
jgi:hypothetical protein